MKKPIPNHPDKNKETHKEADPTEPILAGCYDPPYDPPPITNTQHYSRAELPGATVHMHNDGPYITTIIERHLPPQTNQTDSRLKAYKTTLGRNIDKWRRCCGWSYDQLAGATGIDKHAVWNHVNTDTRPRPSTVLLYAQAFSRQLDCQITVEDLEA